MTALLFSVAWLYSLEAKADAPRPDCFMLSVGIDNYSSAPLKGCVNDARNMAQQFQGQKGRMFGQVGMTILVDQDGSRARIGKELDRLKRVGKPGDFIVVFLSGHGSNANPGQWHFVPQDHAGKESTKLADVALLQFADALAIQGKKVLLIIDACFAGQLRVNARDQLNKTYPRGGGLILMVSSMPTQTSAAMGNFSAFAQAVFEGLSGQADFNGDGYVTLREVRSYAYHRVHEMQKKGAGQDGEIDYSLSIPDTLRLAKAGKSGGSLAGTRWRGKETLANYGALTFRFMPGNQVIMQDKAGESTGTWSLSGNRAVLRFSNGQTVYTGTWQGDRLAGTARVGGNQPWSFDVALQ